MKKYLKIFLSVVILNIFAIPVFAADTWVPTETVVNCGVDMRNDPSSPQPNFSYIWINGSSGTTYRYFFNKNTDVELKQGQTILSVALTAKSTGGTVGILHTSNYIKQIQLN